jgi:hypothetical protein
MLRSVVFWIHLTLGVAAGLVILVLSLSKHPYLTAIEPKQTLELYDL